VRSLRKSPTPNSATLLLYVAVVVGMGWMLQLSGMFQRQELQQINKQFELRYLLLWDPISLHRLNPQALWRYHQNHEVNKSPLPWDYTLSWLIENNHPKPTVEISIFNHETEDEPPPEAVTDHPWMKSLLKNPLARRDLAEIVRALARAGAKAIILDRDFPQQDPGDRELAQAIHECSNGTISGKEIPVFMIRSVYRSSSAHAAVIQTATIPSGVLSELQRLEPSVNIAEKYTGTCGLYSDEDQVVRRFVLRMPSIDNGDSVVLKALQSIAPKVTDEVPDLFDINFISPPNSTPFPVRSMSYLLDPVRKSDLLNPPNGYRDISVKNRIVIIGDGLTDTFNTPYSNIGINMMSGSEVLAHALNTANGKNWLHRLDTLECLVYIFILAIVSAVIIRLGSCPALSLFKRTPAGWRSLLADLLMLAFILISTNLVAALAFSLALTIFPLIVPCIAITTAFVVRFLLEREQLRTEALRHEMSAAEQRHKVELLTQQAEAHMREQLLDTERRHDFISRINHDLKAPLTVINWNLAKLQQDGLTTSSAPQKLERLVKTSDRLFDLVAELTSTYDSDHQLEHNELLGTKCNLASVLSGCANFGQSLAEINSCSVEMEAIDDSFEVMCEPLDLSRTIDNLVKNAIVHNEEGTNISLHVHRFRQYFVIYVNDNGRGIPNDHLTKIFDARYRVKPDDGRGTGLGLSIAKLLVEKNGGSISVTSREGVGTTFLVAVRAAESTHFNTEQADDYLNSLDSLDELPCPSPGERVCK
jgi:signal transduction histidine kinase